MTNLNVNHDEKHSPTPAAAATRAAAAPGAVAAENVNPAAEEIFWRIQYAREPYLVPNASYDDYAPAYLTGYLGYVRLFGHRYEEIEGELERDYSANRGGSGLGWLEARPAVRAAWDRLEHPKPRAPSLVRA